MTLYDYTTAKEIRELTSQEAAHYMTVATDDTGAVDGTEFGYDGTVYAI